MLCGDITCKYNYALHISTYTRVNCIAGNAYLLNSRGGVAALAFCRGEDGGVGSGQGVG